MTHEITAYEVADPGGWVLEPMERRREWMDQTPNKGANRCLPLVIANQAGWVLRFPGRFKARWSGKANDHVAFTFPEREKQISKYVMSIFGSGIISFRIPWLFRTSEGLALMVRGATNCAKENIVPLDGIVETSWAPSPFTMNWRILKPKTDVWFRPGDPICMIIPYPLAILDATTTRLANIADNPELADQYAAWERGRADQYRRRAAGEENVYELDYVRGSKPDGTFADAHFSKLSLDGFAVNET